MNKIKYVLLAILLVVLFQAQPADASAKVLTTKEAQYLLVSHGYVLKVDGINGPQTQRAVRNFQKVSGLKVDGLVGPVTSAKLISSAATTQVPAVRLAPPPAQPPDVQLLPPATPDVESIIRYVWPDNLEDRAVSIAYRESRFQPTVHTWCCWGIFQIHVQHLGWLCDAGIACTINDLKDSLTNIKAAYALYQRDGWGPWALR